VAVHAQQNGEILLGRAAHSRKHFGENRVVVRSVAFRPGLFEEKQRKKDGEITCIQL
jgi:hypothetical protein